MRLLVACACVLVLWWVVGSYCTIWARLLFINVSVECFQFALLVFGFPLDFALLVFGFPLDYKMTNHYMLRIYLEGITTSEIVNSCW